MVDYQIPQQAARSIAIGLYRHIGVYVASAKHDNPEDYKRFKRECLAQQEAQSKTAIKRRSKRNVNNPKGGLTGGNKIVKETKPRQQQAKHRGQAEAQKLRHVESLEANR